LQQTHIILGDRCGYDSVHQCYSLHALRRSAKHNYNNVIWKSRT